MSETTLVSPAEHFRSGLCIHTSRAIKALSGGKPGDVILLGDMEKAVGRPCGNGDNGRGNVASAINRVLNEKGLFWKWVRGLGGWKCFDASEKNSHVSTGMRGIHRKANRLLRVAATIDPKQLTDDERRDYTLNGALVGAIRVIGHGGTRKKLESVIDKVIEPDASKVLALMQK